MMLKLMLMLLIHSWTGDLSVHSVHTAQSNLKGIFLHWELFALFVHRVYSNWIAQTKIVVSMPFGSLDGTKARSFAMMSIPILRLKCMCVFVWIKDGTKYSWETLDFWLFLSNTFSFGNRLYISWVEHISNCYIWLDVNENERSKQFQIKCKCKFKSKYRPMMNFSQHKMYVCSG